MIEIYDYETSQNEMTSGLRNPIPEFQKLCNDFVIINVHILITIKH